jgi:hypothetical protein
MIKVRLKKNVKMGCPGLPGRTYEYDEGEFVEILDIDYPSKPFVEGSIGWFCSESKVNNDWAFWTSFDIDYSIIFDDKDIDLLVLTDEDIEKWKAIIPIPKSFQIRFSEDF